MVRKPIPKQRDEIIRDQTETFRRTDKDAQYRQAALEMALVGKRDLVVNPAQVVRDADRYFQFMTNGTVETAE